MIEAVVVMVALGSVLGIGLGFASEKLHVEPDPAFDDLMHLLPGLNCGACGYPGCAGLADAFIDQDTDDVALCKPSTKEQRVAITEYLKEYFENKGKKTNKKA